MFLKYVIVGLNYGTRPRITMYSADFPGTVNSDVMMSWWRKAGIHATTVLFVISDTE